MQSLSLPLQPADPLVTRYEALQVADLLARLATAIDLDKVAPKSSHEMT